ncbi:proline--tRNA ligase [Caldivirga sp. UBA161]|uniref:proline--tRNA ligase n=1 Tax=Caldivirga sp. UBA161 TaxID=1915569 RepID=UPI0025BB97B4|nr:proline--tRNA ligase [Caldivirga sp. UBA161]
MKVVRGPQERPRSKWSSFIEWFNKVIMDAEIYDYRYPVKGAYIWRPYGVAIRRNVEALIRRLHDEAGHQEVLFPIFIPYEFFSKESEHIRGFESEVFWVSKGTGGEERLILRPTSETAMMPMFKLWIRDHTDLPLRVYQIVSVFRAETKMTHPMIRLREISMFKEAHTAHADRDDAERQVKEAVNIYRKIMDELCIPYLISRRPEWDKFAGAVYTIAFDTIMPDGKTMQIGTVHYLGENFSRVFDVKYLGKDGQMHYVHTTSYGISERIIASMITINGDDRGLLLPPRYAPIQVIMIPIMYGEDQDVLNYVKNMSGELLNAGVRVHVDDRRDKTPGWKFYYWELKGVPIRLEVGPSDVKENVVTLTRRDTFEKYVIPRGNVVEAVKELMNTIEDNMRKSAWEWLRSHVKRSSNVSEAKSLLNKGGVVEVPWSGDDECGKRIMELTESDALGIPLDINDTPSDLHDAACSNKKAEYWLRLSRRY